MLGVFLLPAFSLGMKENDLSAMWATSSSHVLCVLLVKVWVREKKEKIFSHVGNQFFSCTY